MTDIAMFGLGMDTTGLKKGEKGLDSLTRAGERTEGSMKGLQRTALAAFTTFASFQTLKAATTQITAFEDSMLGLQATINGTTTDMAALEKQARSLGASSIYSASEAAQGQRFLAQAGFDVNETLSATPDILKLATAGQLSLASAADLASNVLGGMRLEVDQLNRVNDVLAKTASSSNTNIEQLGQALSYAAPIAAGAGISIEEASAAIGKLSDNGLQGTRAGTGLLGVIRQLSKITPQAAAALATYGLSTEDVSIESNGLSNVLDKLRIANINTADSFEIFGSEAGPAAQILAANSKEVVELTAKLQSAQGAATDMADIIESGLSASFKSFNSQVSESVLQLGEHKGALKDVTDTATGVIAVYNGMIDEFAEANKLTGEQKDDLISIANALDLTASAALGAAGAYATYTAGAYVARAATLALTASMATNPVTLAILAFGAAGGAIYTYSDSAEDATKNTKALNVETTEAARIAADLKKNVDALNGAYKGLEKTKLEAEKARLERIHNDLFEQSKLIKDMPIMTIVDENTINMLNSTGEKLAAVNRQLAKFQGDSSKTGSSEGFSFPLEGVMQAHIAAQDELNAKIMEMSSTYAGISLGQTLVADIAKINELLEKATAEQVPALERALATAQGRLADTISGNYELNLEVNMNGLSEGLDQAAAGMQSLASIFGSESKDMIVAVNAISAAQAIAAVLNQGSGDPYTAFARMAAMAAAVSKLGQSVSFSGTDTTSADRQAAQGTGTVLGSSEEQSESIANGIDLIASSSDELVDINTKQLDALRSLRDGISGASGLISQGANFNLGDINQGTSLSNLYEKTLDFFNKSNGIAGSLSKLSIANKIGGSIFGGSGKVSDEGIKILGGTIDQILQNTTAQAFQDVKIDGGWFSSDKTKNYTAAVSGAVESQIDLVYQGIVDSVVAGAELIGLSSAEINSTLSSFVFDSLNISLKGMNADEQTTALEAVFSSAFDKLANSMTPFIAQFQDAGESVGDTLSRLSTELQVAQTAASRLGQSINLGVVGNLTIADLMTDLSGGLEAFATNVSGFTKNFFSSAEQAGFYADALTDSLNEMGMALPTTEAGFRSLVEAQNANTQAGAANIAMLLDMQDEVAEYFSLQDQAFGSITEFVKELMGLEADGTQSLASARSAYQTALAAAAAGDEDAIESLTGLAQTYLDLSKANASTSAQAGAAQSGVINDLLGIVPAFASGGFHSGGVALVGENGPELVNMGPSQVYSNSDSAKLLNNTDLIAALNQLISMTVSGINSNNSDNTKMLRILQQWQATGVLIDSDTPVRVETV